ncbi:hypothetical protein, partial [Actinomadura sp. WAC 06369]|uniref:hypothetical protein n=1 Tax=Actinomadura sp. WAC 06369 TaxID=2203193 RepID=UPI001003AD83
MPPTTALRTPLGLPPRATGDPRRAPGPVRRLAPAPAGARRRRRRRLVDPVLGSAGVRAPL